MVSRPTQLRSFDNLVGMTKRIFGVVMSIWFLVWQPSTAVRAQDSGLSDRSSVPEFINGVDVSFLDHYERNGVVFQHDGVPTDPLEIFKAHGVNTIRLRLWHTPPPEWDFNGLDRTLQMAARVKDAGFAFLLDFHYSDWWADPGQQNKPSVWAGLPFETLKDSVREYTRYVIAKMSAQGTTPDMVQLGNEITSGMLWDAGRVGGPFDTPEQWQKLAELVHSADSGLTAGLAENEEKPLVMIHIDRGGDPDGTEWFFSNLLASGVDLDLIGLSYYPFWHGSLSRLERTLRTAAIRFRKDLVVVETAYPWTLDWFDNVHNIVGLPGQLLDGYPASVGGQRRFLRDAKSVVRAAPLGHGKGLVYWEPAYIAARGLGSPWENLALFDDEANALESMSAFDDSSPVAGEPSELPFDLPSNISDVSDVRVTGFPNPFSGTTTIRLSLPESDIVSISVFDLTGRKVASLIDRTLRLTGVNEVRFDGTGLPAGLYVVRVEAERSGRFQAMLIHRY